MTTAKLARALPGVSASRSRPRLLALADAGAQASDRRRHRDRRSTLDRRGRLHHHGRRRQPLHLGLRRRRAGRVQYPGADPDRQPGRLGHRHPHATA